MVHAQVGEADDGGQDLVNPDDDLLAVDRREGRHAEVAGPVVVLDRDPAVLRVPALDDVQVRHHLEPADHRRGHGGLDEEDVLELAVDPVAHPQAVSWESKWMSVARQSKARSRIWLDHARARGRSGSCSWSSLRTSRWCWVRSGESGSVAIGGARPWSPAACRTVSSASAREPLEGELVEQLGRDQIELEDRLAQVALVLVRRTAGPTRTWSAVTSPRLIRSRTRTSSSGVRGAESQRARGTTAPGRPLAARSTPEEDEAMGWQRDPRPRPPRSIQAPSPGPETPRSLRGGSINFWVV